jgi:hypothetical protein
MNLDGIGLIATVEDHVWADIRGLEGYPEGTLSYKYMRGGDQVFENERGWHGMPGCWYGPKLPDVDPQPGRKVSDVGAFTGEGTKNSPTSRRGEPYTSTADAAFKSSFLTLRIPSRTNGRTSAQCSSAWHIRAAFG